MQRQRFNCVVEVCFSLIKTGEHSEIRLWWMEQLSIKAGWGWHLQIALLFIISAQVTKEVLKVKTITQLQ